jgi:hypothetical protein
MKVWEIRRTIKGVMIGQYSQPIEAQRNLRG